MIHHGFIDIKVVLATSWRHNVLYLPLYFSETGAFLLSEIKKFVSSLVASIIRGTQRLFSVKYLLKYHVQFSKLI